MTRLLLLSITVFIMLSACENNESKKEMNDNPFFSEWTTPYGVPPFDKIKEEHYLPAFESAIQKQNAEIDVIVNNPEPPTFGNTVAALDMSGNDLRKVGGVFFNLTEAFSNDKISEIEAEIAPKLAVHKDNIMLNADLFNKVKQVYDQQKEINIELEIGNEKALNQEQKALLDFTYQEFVRGGSELNDADQAKLRKVNKKLASLYPKFGNIPIIICSLSTNPNYPGYRNPLKMQQQKQLHKRIMMEHGHLLSINQAGFRFYNMPTIETSGKNSTQHG